MWTLKVDRGRQWWEYDEKSPQKTVIPEFNRGRNPNSGDMVYRAQALKANYKEMKLPTLPAEASLPEKAEHAALKAGNFYQALQSEDGHWPGDYGGPMFLMPGMVITHYVTQTEIPEPTRQQMVKYLFNHQRSDGGWGIHIEADSTMFGTVLNYITVRMLGAPANDERVARARALIHKYHAYAVPSWGKFWMAVAGVFDWSGMNSIFPEMWALPNKLPFHPGNWWCHCRMVYLPMAYAYGHRVTGPITPLIQELRRELYTQPYESLNWPSFRTQVSPLDVYTPYSCLLKVGFRILSVYERKPFQWLRRKALDFILEYVRAEDEHTQSIDIGPVSKFINMLCIWHADGPNSQSFKAHKERVVDYLWLAEDGMKVQGYNGSQLWDTAFAAQAYTESPAIAQHFTTCLQKSYQYAEVAQVMEDVRGMDRYYRHISKGGWPFSTRDHGWPIADCTAEGLQMVLALHDGIVTDPAMRTITDQRIFDAINVVLSFQNPNGGWATYELQRAGGWMELINPAEVFSGIMVDYCYVELSSACVQALARFRRYYPEHRRTQIESAIRKGAKYMLDVQRPDGSWYGSWAVCFTYGAWFGIEGLVAAGTPTSSPAIRNACEFILSKQKEDGGWGESFQACVTRQYSEHKESQVVNTAWALLALMAADWHDERPIRKAIELLIQRQQDNGDWEQEGISGVFNGNCMITYTAYRNVFPLWALARYREWSRKRS